MADRREYGRNWKRLNATRLNAEKRARHAANPTLQRERLKNNRIRKLEFVHTHKRDKPCVDCGQSFHPVAMDFDHVEGEKKATVAVLANECASFKRLEEEMAKCVLRCANCHRIKHYRERHE